VVELLDNWTYSVVTSRERASSMASGADYGATYRNGTPTPRHAVLNVADAYRAVAEGTEDRNTTKLATSSLLSGSLMNERGITLTNRSGSLPLDGTVASL